MYLPQVSREYLAKSQVSRETHFGLSLRSGIVISGGGDSLLMSPHRRIQMFSEGESLLHKEI